MANEFKFRALTSDDWKDINDEDLTDERGLRLKGDNVTGRYISKPLDSGIDDCCWHRIVLDAEVPENSTISVSFYSSEEEGEDEDPKNWSETIVFKNAGDALVQAPHGRYIRLKIDFYREEGEESPVLRQVKIYYPRLSYLRYLPAVYQEESASKEFLERFLAIFESALYDSEETISRLSLYFDPKATPKDFVPWLARWLSLDLYELLGAKNREFILRAVEVYKQKGTVSGIARLVSFLTGRKCCVKEYMNNIFRTYGMEHYGGEEIADEHDCKKFYRNMSRTVDTANPDLIANMGTYDDEVHYVTSKTGRYSPHVIGLFIFLLEGEKELKDEEELRRILKTFLPVFVRAEIIPVKVPIGEDIDVELEEGFKDVETVYTDKVDWKWLYTNTDADKGRSNELQYRTPHSKIGVELI